MNRYYNAHSSNLLISFAINLNFWYSPVLSWETSYMLKIKWILSFVVPRQTVARPWVRSENVCMWESECVYVREWMWERERVYVCMWEREWMCSCERESECVYVRERVNVFKWESECERERVYVCMWEREWMCLCERVNIYMYILYICGCGCVKERGWMCLYVCVFATVRNSIKK